VKPVGLDSSVVCAAAETADAETKPKCKISKILKSKFRKSVVQFLRIGTWIMCSEFFENHTKNFTIERVAI